MVFVLGLRFCCYCIKNTHTHIRIWNSGIPSQQGRVARPQQLTHNCKEREQGVEEEEETEKNICPSEEEEEYVRCYKNV